MTATETQARGAATARQRGQYLSFRLAGEEYALDILRVQEIKGFSRVTPLPHSPPEVRGVMNLRGAVIPIIDLRIRFGLGSSEINRFSVIIVVNVAGRIVGLVVDAVSDVLNIEPEQIDRPPQFGNGIDSSFLNGIARVGERLVTLFHVEHLIGSVIETPSF